MSRVTAARGCDIKETIADDDPAFDTEDLTRDDDDHVSLNAPAAKPPGSPTSEARSLAKQGRKRVRDEIHWRIKRVEIKD